MKKSISGRGYVGTWLGLELGDCVVAQRGIPLVRSNCALPPAKVGREGIKARRMEEAVEGCMYKYGEENAN